MKYDQNRLLTDQQAAIAATKLFDDIKLLIGSNQSTGAVLKEIGKLNPDKTLVLDTISLALGWLLFPKEGDLDRVSYRAVADLLSQHLAGVEYE